MAHVELPQEELQPLVESMQKVFAPFMDAIPSIIRIPEEVERLTKTISDDVDSGQIDRLDNASEKLVDPMIQGLKDFYAKQDADREAELAKIAEERKSAIAEVQKLQELGVPAEVTKQNTVNILNEKEIIEKQKEYIKEQKEVSFLEEQIAKEKSKGDDANPERLLMLKDALESQNELLREQGKVLGDRLPMQKVKDTVGARDFIPDPLLDVFDNIKDGVSETFRTLGSFAKPITKSISIFTKRNKLEEESIENKEKETKSSILSMVLTTVKFIALAAAIAFLIKGIYKAGKMLGLIEDPLKRKPNETQQEMKERLINEEGMSNVEAGKISREQTSDFDFVPRMLGLGGKLDELEQKKMLADAQKDENKRAFDMRNQFAREELMRLGGGAANQANATPNVNSANTYIHTNNNIAQDNSTGRASTRGDAITSGDKA